MVRFFTSVIAAGALIGMPAAAQKRSPSDAAKSFTLDPAALAGAADQTPPTSATVPDEAPPPATTLATPVTPEPAPTIASTPDPAANAPIVMKLGPAPSLDTPIGQLIADPRSRAVLDRDMPGLSTDENLGHFQQFSLRRFQSMTGGQLTPALLTKVGADLAALDEKAETTLAPVAPSPSRRRKQDDGR